MSDPSPISKARSGSQKRQPTTRRVCYFDEHDNALFEQAYAEYRRSRAMIKYGDSEGAFIRYMTIGEGARPLPKAKQRGPRINPDLQPELVNMLGRLLGQMGRDGNNLNQIARHLNESGEALPDHIRATHEEYRDTMRAIRKVLGWED